MSQLFDNYTAKKSRSIPDNTCQFLKIKPAYDEVIVLGADNTHCFMIPHRFEEIEHLKIVYNQGIETKVVKEYPILYEEKPNIEEEIGNGLGSMLGVSTSSEELDNDSTETDYDDDYLSPTSQDIISILENFGEEPEEIIPPGAIHWDFKGNAKYWKSLISFDITEEETKKFNWYNQDVNVQIFVTLKNGHFEPIDPESNSDNSDIDYPIETISDFDYEIIDTNDEWIDDKGPYSYDVSPIYKVKIVRKLEEGAKANE